MLVFTTAVYSCAQGENESENQGIRKLGDGFDIVLRMHVCDRHIKQAMGVP